MTIRRLLLHAILLAATGLPSLAQDLPQFYPGSDYFEARITEARAALAKSPNSAPALTSLGYWLCVSREDRKEAREALERSYELAPSQASAMLLASSWLSENDKERAEWALRAMSFPPPSLHALAAFEMALKSSPELSSLENADVRRLRARRDRWQKELRSHEQRIPSLILTDQESRDPLEAERAWPSSERKFDLKGQRLVATSKGGKKLWESDLGPEPVKLVAQPPRVFVIDARRVRVLDQESGRKLHEWPSAVPLALAEVPESWSLWEQPQSLMGANGDWFFMKAGRWLCVLRQKDARGWAVYYSARIRAELSEDGQVLVTEHNHSMVTAWSMADHRKLWEYVSGWSYQLRLLDVTPTEVVISLPGKGQLIALSRQTGRPLWTRSHLSSD